MNTSPVVVSVLGGKNMCKKYVRSAATVYCAAGITSGLVDDDRVALRTGDIVQISSDDPEFQCIDLAFVVQVSGKFFIEGIEPIYNVLNSAVSTYRREAWSIKFVQCFSTVPCGTKIGQLYLEEMTA